MSDEKWAAHAGQAMVYAGRLDSTKFARELAAAKAAGARSLAQVMVAWVDATLDLIGAPIGRPMRMLFIEQDGDETESTDDLDPPMAWAMRFINARCARDRESCKALLMVLPSGLDRLSYAYALANTCADTSKAHLRGAR